MTADPLEETTVKKLRDRSVGYSASEGQGSSSTDTQRPNRTTAKFGNPSSKTPTSTRESRPIAGATTKTTSRWRGTTKDAPFSSAASQAWRKSAPTGLSAASTPGSTGGGLLRASCATATQVGTSEAYIYSRVSSRASHIDVPGNLLPQTAMRDWQRSRREECKKV